MQTLLFLALTASAFAQDLQDPKYSFDGDKLKAAENSYQFLRSFVDYYYLLVKANVQQLDELKAPMKAHGWCAGDAHPENFGAVLLDDKSSVFTVNDYDDAGPCPVVLDAFRLMVAAHIYDSGIDTGKLLDEYADGLEGKSRDVPGVLEDKLKDSEKKGTEPKGKKIDGKKLVRDDQAREVAPGERRDIDEALAPVKHAFAKGATLLDLFATEKVGGGSGGLRRYELLYDNGGSLLHLELKTLATPSVKAVATSAVPSQKERIETSIGYDMGKHASDFYQVVKVGGKEMLLRPRFKGDLGVDLSKDSDVEKIIRYEAWLLGTLHAKSLDHPKDYARDVRAIDEKKLEGYVDDFADQFKKKYKELK
jgi:hypothetical protein